ncbi:MAG: hypothetical protein R3C05_06060 [Pirellulaceae bacterium]
MRRITTASMRWSFLSFLFVGWLVGSATELSAQRRQGRRPRSNPFATDGLMSMFRIPEVQGELELTREQAELIFALQSDLYSEYRNARRNPAEGSGLPTADEVRTKGRLVADRVLAAILGEASFERLNELWLQKQGLRAINSDRFADRLSLSQEQRDAIRELLSKLSRDYGEREPNASDKEIAEQVLALLTAEQQTNWEQMLGEPFSFR